jgi:hypothetical protein
MNIAFFDIGASNVQIYIIFVNKKLIFVEELSYSFYDLIGGRDFDILIYKLLVKICPFEVSLRSEQILLNEAVKIKHRLTLENYCAGTIDFNNENQTISYNISRENFEEACIPILTQVSRLIEESLNGINVDIVQMIGGLSRIPCIQEIVKKIFHVQKLQFSMNQDESISIGAAYIAASRKSDFKIPFIRYQRINLTKFVVTDSEKSYSLENFTFNEGMKYWLFETTEHSPIGAYPYIIWGVASSNSSFHQTEDHLFKMSNPKEKYFNYFKHQVISIGKEIEQYFIDQKKLESTVNELEDLLLIIKELLYDEEKLKNIQQKKKERKFYNIMK